MKTHEILNNIIFTLERVSVRGAEDMSRMLGVLQALGELREELRTHEQSPDDASRQQETDDFSDPVRRV